MSQSTTPTSSNSYEDLQGFLTKHVVKKGDTSKIITNTRIGDKTAEIYGGSYHIPDEEYELFLKLYNTDVIQPKKKEYLTEKQRDTDGPILIDVDFRHSIDIDERQYNKDHIEDLLEIYLDECKNIFQPDENTNFQIFVFEKPTVNQLKEKKITKDGIHIIISLKADHIIQLILREKVIKKIGEVWTDLNLTNTWEDVFDKGISVGTTNWQLYGSRKPNHDRYQLTHVYQVGFDENDGEFTRQEISLTAFDISKNLQLLSVRYKNNPSLFIKNSFIPTYEEYKKKIGGNSTSSSSSRTQPSPFGGDNEFGSFNMDLSILSKIKNQEELDSILNRFIDGLGLDEYVLREAYEYAMILPPSYYEMGSYTKWTRLCWALRNTSNKLLIVFLKISSKSSTFCYATHIAEICQRWQNTDLRIKNGLTKRSLENWVKTEAKEEYLKVKERSIDTYVENTIQMNCSKNESKSNCGDFDLASVLYQANKGKYVCASVKIGLWYGIDKHRWKEIDSGTTLRKFISTKMRDLYTTKSLELYKRVNERNTVLDMIDENGDNNEPPTENTNTKNKDEEYMKIRANSINNISQRLARTNDKKNIMTEAKELFYDGDFIQLLDTNPYLICFNNGVFDFKEKVFRDGHPEDYISMSTNINYIKIVPEIHQPIVDEINDFMNKLFPIPDLCRYMWDHLASCLIGTCLNQTFNIYIGIGQNGKSVLINLMEKVLGDYKGDVPLTLVTEKRGKVGGLAPEIVQLKGKRFAVMQEPSKGDKINEGIMKQLTSGKDPIQGRAPYMPQTISFIPQFNLVVTANVLMKIESNDHGTWRRIRAVPFLSLFTENPVTDDPEKPYQFPIDKNIDEKFDSWKEVFASLLVERACKTGGIVKDCNIVMEKSAEYRKSQDYISEFMQERLIRNREGKIQKSELNHEFVLWFSNNYGTKGPSPKDLHEQMDKEYGRPKNGIWYGVGVKYTEKNNTENEDNETEGEDMDDIDL
jgi:P4 family phage/plasmid primase-like protien